MKTKRQLKVVEVYARFIRRMYKEAGLSIPEDFYPHKEAKRVAHALRIQCLGIKP